MIKKLNFKDRSNIRKLRLLLLLALMVAFLIFLPWLWKGIAGDRLVEVVLLVSWIVLFLTAFSSFETFKVYIPGKEKLLLEWCFWEFTIDFLFIVFIYSALSIGEISWLFLLGNGLPIYIVMRLIYFFTGSFFVSQAVAGVATFLICGGSYYVQFNRGTPLYPWDIFGIPTLATVSGATTVECNRNFVLSLCVLALCFMTSTFLYNGEKRTKACLLWSAICPAIAIVVMAYWVFPSLTNSMWNAPQVYEKQGAVASYLAYSEYILPKNPKGYSKEAADSLLEEWENKDVAPIVEAGSVQPVNLIVIMNEAWSDLSKVGEGIDMESPMTFVDSLEENTIKGNLYSSVKGGGTCNTEFEVLTGFTTAYYAGYPYVSSMHHDTKGLASLIEERGYNTEAFHPFMADNWSRPKVYKELGFDSFVSKETLEEQGRYQTEGFLRSSEFTSDANDFAVVKEDEGAADGSTFIFNVTMQNHTEFTQEYVNLRHRTDLSAYGDFSAATQYFDLMYETDAAFEDLIEYYENYDEPTMIVMFGDHQPAVEEDFYQLLAGKSKDQMTAEDVVEQYVTPFIVWTNYDMKSAYVEKISANYLGALILDAAGIEKDGYWKYLTDLYRKYPVISAFGCYDAEGDFYESIKSLDENILTQYKQLMYHRINGN